jgi:hypothetical protein
MVLFLCILRLKCDGTRVETRFRLSAKRTSPFKSAGASVLSTTGSRGVRTSGSNAGYTMFRGSVKSTGYPLHSPVSPSLSLPCVTVCHHISVVLYLLQTVFLVNTSRPPSHESHLQLKMLHRDLPTHRNILYFKLSRLTVGPTQPFLQGFEWPGREAEHMTVFTLRIRGTVPRLLNVLG